MSISPELLQLMLQNTNEGIVLVDEDFQLVFSNQKAREFHGWDNQFSAVDWQSYLTILEPDGITPTPLDQLPIVRAMYGETIANSYNFIKCRGKEPRLVKYNAKTLLDEQGKKLVFITIQDCQDLAHSLVRFQGIFEQAPFSIIILNIMAQPILVNNAFKDIWQIPPELMKDFFQNFNLLKDRRLNELGLTKLFQKAFDGEMVELPETLYNPLDWGIKGQPRWITGVVYPLKNAIGVVTEVIIIHQDTSDSRLAKKEKNKLLYQIEALLQQLPSGVMVSDLNKEIIFYNKQMTKLIGNPEQAKDILQVPIQNALEGTSFTSCEQGYQHPDGDLSYLGVTSAPILDDQQKITASVVIASDITSDKRHSNDQAFLAQVKTLLISTLDIEHILEGITNLTINYLADGCIIDIIDDYQFKRLLSRHHDPTLQKLMDELKEKFPPSYQSTQPTIRSIFTGIPSLTKNLTPELIRCETYNQEHAELIFKIGIKTHISIPLVIRGKITGAITLFNTHGPQFDDNHFHTAQEMARYASLAIDNATLFKDAQSAIKLRDDFISMASHELRTPITSLRLQIEVLNSLIKEMDGNAELNTQAKKFLGNTNVQLHRLSHLIDDMLDISRIRTGKMTITISEVNLTQLIKEVLERFNDQLRSLNITATFSAPADIFYPCDRDRMDQVLTNFMTNAIRYGLKKPIQIILEETKVAVLLKVKDNGLGIAPEDQEKIFKQFERAHSVDYVNGLGLGLYINHQIIKNHKGRITVDSALGKGSTFIVELPTSGLLDSLFLDEGDF